MAQHIFSSGFPPPKNLHLSHFECVPCDISSEYTSRVGVLLGLALSQHSTKARPLCIRRHWVASRVFAVMGMSQAFLVACLVYWCLFPFGFKRESHSSPGYARNEFTVVLAGTESYLPLCAGVSGVSPHPAAMSIL